MEMSSKQMCYFPRKGYIIRWCHVPREATLGTNLMSSWLHAFLQNYTLIITTVMEDHASASPDNSVPLQILRNMYNSVREELNFLICLCDYSGLKKLQYEKCKTIFILSDWIWLLDLSTDSLFFGQKREMSRPLLGIVLPGNFQRFPGTCMVPRFGGKDTIYFNTVISTTSFRGDVTYSCLCGFIRPGTHPWQDRRGWVGERRGWGGTLDKVTWTLILLDNRPVSSHVCCTSSDWPFILPAIFSPSREQQSGMRKVLSLHVFLRLQSVGFGEIRIGTFSGLPYCYCSLRLMPSLKQRKRKRGKEGEIKQNKNSSKYFSLPLPLSLNTLWEVLRELRYWDSWGTAWAEVLSCSYFVTPPNPIKIMVSKTYLDNEMCKGNNLNMGYTSKHHYRDISAMTRDLELP